MSLTSLRCQTKFFLAQSGTFVSFETVTAEGKCLMDVSDSLKKGGAKLFGKWRGRSIRDLERELRLMDLSIGRRHRPHHWQKIRPGTGQEVPA